MEPPTGLTSAATASVAFVPVKGIALRRRRLSFTAVARREKQGFGKSDRRQRFCVSMEYGVGPLPPAPSLLPIVGVYAVDLRTAQVKDCVDPLKMGYTYQEVPNLWAGAGHNNYKPATVYVTNKPTSPVTPVSEFGPETKKLDAPIHILVSRPNAPRTSLEKSAEVEVLHLNAVDVVPSGQARFNIYIAAPVGGGNLAGQDYGEFAGSYVKPLRVHSKKEADEFAVSPPQGKRRYKFDIFYVNRLSRAPTRDPMVGGE